MQVVHEVKENLNNRALKRPIDESSANLTPRKVRRNDGEDGVLLKDCVNVNEVLENQDFSSNASTIPVIIGELITKVNRYNS